MVQTKRDSHSFAGGEEELKNWNDVEKSLRNFMNILDTAEKDYVFFDEEEAQDTRNDGENSSVESGSVESSSVESESLQSESNKGLPNWNPNFGSTHSVDSSSVLDHLAIAKSNSIDEIRLHLTESLLDDVEKDCVKFAEKKSSKQPNVPEENNGKISKSVNDSFVAKEAREAITEAVAPITEAVAPIIEAVAPIIEAVAPTPKTYERVPTFKKKKKQHKAKSILKMWYDGTKADDEVKEKKNSKKKKREKARS